MDLIYRKEKYRKILQKISHLQEGTQTDNNPEDHKVLIQDSVNEILEDLKDKSDIQEVRILYISLLSPLLIILVYHSWSNGIGISFGYLAALTLFFFGSNLAMKNYVQENRNLKWGQTGQELTGETYLSNKIKYAASAIKIKEQRLLLLLVFYCLFFAPLLVFSYYLIFKAYPFGNCTTALLIAYLISAPVWYFIYSPDRDELLETEQELYNQQEKLLSK